MRLDIPFTTQANNRHRNDCAAACIASLVGIDIDAVLAVLNLPENTPYHVQHILDTLRHFGLHGRYTRPTTLPMIQIALKEQYPIICLVDYAQVPPPYRATDFAGAHWVLVTGSDGPDLWLHDPLHPTDGHRRWPASVLYGAMFSHEKRFLPHQSIVVAKAYPLVDLSREMGQAVAAQMNLTVREMREELTIAHAYLEQLYAALGVPGTGDEAQGHALAAILQLKK